MRAARHKPVRFAVPPGFSNEFTPRQLARSLSAGVLLYFLEIIVVVSLAALIFSSRLAGQLPAGLGLLIAGDTVLFAGMALFSSYAGSIAVVQDTSCVMIAIVAAGLLTHLPPGAGAAQRLATVVVLLVGTTMATGLCFLLLGVFRVGGLVRFLPYPVMGGFLAGTGWLLIVGGLGVMTGTGLTAAMVQPAHLPHWLPGALLGALLLLATARMAHPLLLPGLIGAAVALFYVGAWTTGTPLSRLSAGGWLLGPFPAGSPWRFPLDPAIVSQVDWAALIAQTPGVAPILVVSVIALLLNISGLEVVVKKDIDLNRELVITGLSNLGAGLAGGAIGYPAISMSALNHTLSGGRRLPGLLGSALLGVTALVGTAALGHVPRLVVGALLVYLGLGFVVEWLYRAWFRFPPVDYAMVLLITATIAVVGILPGVLVGSALAVLQFVWAYSRIDVAKAARSGAAQRSTVDRPPQHQQVLHEWGDQVYILQLQGYLFFGTAHHLLARIRRRVAAREQRAVRYIVLDFRLVSGIDVSAVQSLTRLRTLAEQRAMALVLVSLAPALRRQLEQNGFRAGPDTTVGLFPDLDHGVEWCEEQILAACGVAATARRPFVEQLAALLPPERTSLAPRLLDYLERLAVPAGHHLLQQGAPANALYLVEAGRLTVVRDGPDGTRVRLRTIEAGTLLGELGFYLDTPRTASVVAEQASVVYRLTRQRRQEMQAHDPALALAFEELVVRLLAARVVTTTAMVMALLQ